MIRWCVLVAIAACGRIDFDPLGARIAHLPASFDAACEGAITVSSSLIVDTSSAIPLPGAAVYQRVAQPGGSDLAVVCLESLTVEPGVIVEIKGDLPLVIVAIEVVIDGVIDAGAERDRPGPGGADERAGEGGGADGVFEAPFAESGGSGGGFATPGGNGGSSTGGPVETPAGASYGDPELTVLAGGSGGGRGTEGTGCAPEAAGAGGGALQITARAIAIGATGAITVGGGAGGGATACGTNSGSGGGGGSGGAIYLQASRVANTGVLAANGGGGGSGGDDSVPGTDGQDGGPGSVAADGGPPTLTKGGGGGRGGTSTPPEIGAMGNPNAGGGGGSAGRIVIESGDLEVVGESSPPATTIAIAIP